MFNEIDRFVNAVRRRNPGADTAKSYRYHLLKFTQAVGDRSPADITLHDIDNFIEFKATPHMLRHTFGTQLVNAGAKITTIQALLGHERLNTTMVYA